MVNSEFTAHLAEGVEFTDCISAMLRSSPPPSESPGWWGSNPGALRNMEYPFINIWKHLSANTWLILNITIHVRILGTI